MRVVLLAAALALQIECVAAAQAPALIRQPTSIPAQTLESALERLAKERDFQILYRSDVVGNLWTEGAAGQLSADEALTLLLRGTGLTYRYLSDKAVTIVSSAQTASSTTQETATTATDSASAEAANAAKMRLVEAQNAAGAAPAQAPEQTESSDSRKSSDALEEIVVTAQRREQRLQDVPISMSVLSGADLDRETVRDITEMLGRVPGVSTIQSSLGGYSQFPVRGVASQSFADTGASPTAYYLDAVPFGFANDPISPDADAYDLERVEVLRGPQGTLFGANALNGVVRVLTRDPDLQKLEFKARGLTSATEDGGQNFRGDVAVNVPLIEGKLAARAVLGYQDLSGWIDKPIEEDANDAERSTARLKLLAQPTEQLSIGLSAWVSRTDDGAPSVGYDSTHRISLLDEPISTDYDVYGLKIGYDFPGVTLTSTTSYLDYANDYSLDVGDLLVFGTLGARTFAQEIYLASTHEGSWRWTAGSMYRDSKDQDIAYLPPIFAAAQAIGNVSESYALFGELTRLFRDGEWELTAGLRYFEDDLAQTEDSRWVCCFDAPQPGQYIDSDATFSATTPRVVLTWHPSEHMTAYASYSEGFRSGFHQLPVTLTVAPFPPIEPDSLTNYEVGAKGSFLGGRVNVETALYYIDWQDVQQNILVEIAEDVAQAAGVNGESASGVGVDFAMTVSPVDALKLGFNFSWNDLTIDADVLSGGVVFFEKGDRPSSSVEYTMGASADYMFPLGGKGFQGRLSASANYTSEVTSRLLFEDVLVAQGDPMLIARSSFSIRAPQDRWAMTLYADNLNNERGSPSAAINADNLRGFVRPRTIGLQLEYRYQ